MTTADIHRAGRFRHLRQWLLHCSTFAHPWVRASRDTNASMHVAGKRESEKGFRRNRLEPFNFRQHNPPHGTSDANGLPGLRLRLASVLTVVALHVAAVYALLQVEAVRQVVQEAAPLFVDLIRPAVASPAPSVMLPKVVALPEQKAPLLLTATLTPDEAPATVEATPLAVAPVVEEPVVAAAAMITPPVLPEPKTPPPAPQPKLVSGVEYVRSPQPEYPSLSRRMNEAGRVIVRVLINPQGRPEQALVQVSSGFARLDQAAINSALAALFKPHTENGVALHVYALIPITFELTQ